MFIAVMFGAGCRELVNPWCSLATLTEYLKQRARIPPDATIALLSEDGHLVRLSENLEGNAQVPSLGCSQLQERGAYVLVQIIKRDDGALTHYESLLDNLDDHYPQLADELRWLSGLPVTSNGQRRRMFTRRGHGEQGPPSRSRRMASLPSRTR